MIVLVGRRLCDEEKYDGGPDADVSWPNDEKTLVGFVADCELRCELLRADNVVTTAASGVILEFASGREPRNSVEAVVAASRVCDAMASSIVAARRLMTDTRCSNHLVVAIPSAHD